MLREYALQVVDVYSVVKAFIDAGFYFARNPDLQFGIQVQIAGGLDAEARNIFVAHRKVFDLLASKALLIDKNQAVVGEDKNVADQLKTNFNLFGIGQQVAELVGQFFRRCHTGLAYKSGKKAHACLVL